MKNNCKITNILNPIIKEVIYCLEIEDKICGHYFGGEGFDSLSGLTTEQILNIVVYNINRIYPGKAQIIKNGLYLLMIDGKVCCQYSTNCFKEMNTLAILEEISLRINYTFGNSKFDWIKPHLAIIEEVDFQGKYYKLLFNGDIYGFFRDDAFKNLCTKEILEIIITLVDDLSKNRSRE